MKVDILTFFNIINCYLIFLIKIDNEWRAIMIVNGMSAKTMMIPIYSFNDWTNIISIAAMNFKARVTMIFINTVRLVICEILSKWQISSFAHQDKFYSIQKGGGSNPSPVL